MIVNAEWCPQTAQTKHRRAQTFFQEGISQVTILEL